MNPHPFFLCSFCFLSSTSLFAPYLAHTLCLYFSAVYYSTIFSSTHFIFSLPRAPYVLFPSQHTLPSLPSPRQRTQPAHTCRTLLFKKGLTFLFILSPFGLIFGKISDSIIAVMGNRIKCELAGVVHSRTYSCFEALKVRDPRLEPVPHYAIMKTSEEISSISDR